MIKPGAACRSLWPPGVAILLRLGPNARASLLGGAIGVLLGSLMVLVLGSQMNELMVDGARERALDQLQLAVMAELRAADFVPPYTPSAIEDLSARLSPVVARLRGSGVLRVKITDPEGTALFSDGASTPVGLDDMAEANVPIVLGGRVVGAYEIYEDTRPIRPVLVWLWVTIVLASVMVFRLVERLSGANDAQRRQSRAPASARGNSRAPAVTVRSESTARLTRRELQVLRLMATSHGYREIASELVVSEETVRTHAKSILHKLRQPDRTRAVVAAVAAGILELPRRIDANAQAPLDARTASGTSPEQ